LRRGREKGAGKAGERSKCTSNPHNTSWLVKGDGFQKISKERGEWEKRKYNNKKGNSRG